MISYLKGSVEAKNIDSIVIEVGGIGYKVFMSRNSIDKVGELGETVKVHTYMRVREDDISLYGFCSNEELRMFEQLIGVSGVGAKSALTILSNISPSKFALAIISGDVGVLKSLPGIGAKSAQRMILELKDKMKTEEAISLPEQMGNVIYVKNTEEYKKFKKDRIVNLEDKTLVGDTSLTKLLYLRQLASQYNKNKLEALKDIIESTTDRLIIFYNFNEEKKQILDILDRPISVLSGDMKDLRHYENKDNSVTLVQYQAGATGVNLQKANKIIYYSLPLSSEVFEQSKKRIHRIRTKKYMFLLWLNY